MTFSVACDRFCCAPTLPRPLSVRRARGGGAGLGGAVFNQGTLVLTRVTLRDNSAIGGAGGGAAEFRRGGGGPGGSPLPNGGSCTSDSQCASGNCADAVCCDQPCDQPGEMCSIPGRDGTCLTTEAASAPTVSATTLAMGIALLAAIGGIAITRRRLSR